MNQAFKVIYIGQAREAFEQLGAIAKEQVQNGETNSQELQLLKSIREKADAIKSNPMYGECVKKGRIPKIFDVSNLFLVKLSHYWRMLYTIEGNKAEVVAFILWINDHPAYDKLFGYRKK